MVSIPKILRCLLEKVPWYFVSRILEAAKIIAETRNLYPVLITAFKCAPDSFIIEYFKQIFNACHKPYLILQIDEHDSNLGYETRIEAAVRSFKNHSSAPGEEPKVDTRLDCTEADEKTFQTKYCCSRMGSCCIPFACCQPEKRGIDARLMKSSDLIIKKAWRIIPDSVFRLI